VTEVFQGILISQILNHVNVMRKAHKELNAMTIVENVIVTTILLEINVHNVPLNILPSQLVKLVCVMLRDLKIILVTKVENAFVMLTSLEINVMHVLMDLLNSQLVISVLHNILEKPAKNVSVIQKVLLATIAIQLMENAHVMNTSPVIIVILLNQDFLTSLIQNVSYFHFQGSSRILQPSLKINFIDFTRITSYHLKSSLAPVILLQVY